MLQDFNDCYAGPPYWLTSDGGPQFSGANAAIQKWAEEVSIKHSISAAFNPEGNGEAERAVQSTKKAISHCQVGGKSIQSIVANLNHDQRVDGSGSAAEIFLQRTTRVPGLAHLPTQPRDVDQLRAARASSRERQVQATQTQRKPEVFVRGQPVLVQNNLSKLWNIKAKVLSRRSHQGIEANSYLLHVPSTGRQIVRSERNIRQVAGARTNPSGADPDLGNAGLASAVLYNSISVPCKPSSILKPSAYPECLWLSPTRPGVPAPTGGHRELSPTRPDLAPTKECGAALSALKEGLAPAASPGSRPHTPPEKALRTRRVTLSPVLAFVDEEGLESFELEHLRALQKTDGGPTTQHEAPTQVEGPEIIKNQVK